MNFGPGKVNPYVVYDMPEDQYHAHSALSSTGARRIMETCPAVFRYEQTHPKKPKGEFDIGHGVHREALGAGPELVRLNFANRMTKAYKEADADARAQGKVPLLAKDYDQVQAMAAKIRTDTWASQLLADGKPEVSAFWQDDIGVQLRCRFDWLRHPTKDRVLIPDLKSAISANPVAIQKSMYNFGYHCQAAMYIDGAIANGRADRDAVFVLIVQEKTPPYLVTCVSVDPDAVRVGRERNKIAMERYADCLDSGIWPDYTLGRTELPVVSLPTYAYRDEENFLE